MVPTADQMAGNFFDRCITTGQTLVGGIPQTCVPGYIDNSGNRKDQSTGSYLTDPTIATRPFLSSGNLNDLVGKQVNGVDVDRSDLRGDRQGDAEVHAEPEHVHAGRRHL